MRDTEGNITSYPEFDPLVAANERLRAQLDTARAEVERLRGGKDAVLLDETIRAAEGLSVSDLAVALYHERQLRDTSRAEAEKLKADLATANKREEAALSALTAFGVHDPAEKIKRAVVILRGEKPEVLP